MNVAAEFPIDRTHPPRRLVLEGDGIELRPFALDDVDALLRAVTESQAELRAFMPWAHLPKDRVTEFELLRRFSADYWAGREYAFGVFSTAGEMLGCAGLHPRTALNPKALEVGYWCHTKHANRGVITRAVRMLVVLAFDWFESDRVQVMHDEANVASRRVAEKCGFELEGTLRNATASVEPEVVERGYAATGTTRIYSLVPTSLASLPWLPDIRARLCIEDALGGVRAPRV